MTDLRDGVDRWSSNERDLLRGQRRLFIAIFADHSKTLADTFGEHLDKPSGCQSDMTANDQHQPANSRAIAALATTGRFLRSSNRSQRSYNRRLAS